MQILATFQCSLYDFIYNCALNGVNQHLSANFIPSYVSECCCDNEDF